MFFHCVIMSSYLNVGTVLITYKSEGRVKKMKIRFMKQISWYLIVAMFIIGIVPKADAGIAPSEIIVMSQVDRAADIEKIQKVLETKMVRKGLKNLDTHRKRLTAGLPRSATSRCTIWHSR